MGMSEFELSSLEEAGDDGRHVLLIQVSLVADCLLKGPRIFMVLRTLDDLQCDIVKSNPDVKDLENEKFDRSFKMVVITDKQPEQLRDGIESISEIETVEVTDITGGSTGAAPSAPQPVTSPPKPAPQVQAPAASAPPQAPRAQPAAPQPTSNAATQVAEYHQSQAQQAQANTQNSSAAPGEQSQETEEEEKVKEVIELVQLVTFTMAGETYALEIKQVEAIINLVPITRVPKAPMHIDGVINLRGEIVPVINTRRRLRLAELERKPSNQIIILSFEEEKVKAGFLVDSVQEVIRLPETAIEPPSRVSESVDVEYLRGVGKIDNKIIILLNASRIVFGKMAESAV
jgi:purine-binding chemotaxis protein CheW